MEGAGGAAERGPGGLGLGWDWGWGFGKTGRVSDGLDRKGYHGGHGEHRGRLIRG